MRGEQQKPEDTTWKQPMPRTSMNGVQPTRPGGRSSSQPQPGSGSVEQRAAVKNEQASESRKQMCFRTRKGADGEPVRGPGQAEVYLCSS
jgi:hypothetical protein